MGAGCRRRTLRYGEISARERAAAIVSFWKRALAGALAEQPGFWADVARVAEGESADAIALPYLPRDRGRRQVIVDVLERAAAAFKAGGRPHATRELALWSGTFAYFVGDGTLEEADDLSARYRKDGAKLLAGARRIARRGAGACPACGEVKPSSKGGMRCYSCRKLRRLDDYEAEREFWRFYWRSHPWRRPGALAALPEPPAKAVNLDNPLTRARHARSPEQQRAHAKAHRDEEERWDREVLAKEAAMNPKPLSTVELNARMNTLIRAAVSTSGGRLAPPRAVPPAVPPSERNRGTATTSTHLSARRGPEVESPHGKPNPAPQAAKRRARPRRPEAGS